MANKPNIGARIVLDGEKEYNQALKESGKNTSALKSELRALSAEYEGNANSLDALRAKNEVLTKQQSEQEKKLKLLRGALDDVTKVYGENSEQAQLWQTKLNNAYTELNRINKSLNTNQQYMKEAENSTDKTAKSIDQFGKKVKGSKEEAIKFGDILKANIAGDAIIRGVEALGNAIRDVAKATVNVVRDTAAYADNILTMSAQTGIATDKLQELNYMAELTDTSLEDITKTMARNIRSMNSASEGTKLYVDAYRQLGIQVTDSNGQLKDSETIYWSAIDALGKMANETERDAIAMQLFGRSAQDLNPLIKLGREEVAKFAKEARDMGAVLSDDTLKGLGETDDALQRLYQQFDIAKRKVAIEAAPAMTEAIGRISEKIDESDEKFAEFAGGAISDLTDGFIWIIDHADLIMAGLKGITAAIITKKAADGITYVMQAYKTLTTVTQAATAAQVAFNTASKANVIGGLISLAVGLGASLLSLGKSSDKTSENIEKLSDKTQELIDRSKSLREEIEERTGAWKEETDSIEAEYDALDILASKLYDLAGRENKSNSEKQQMISLVKQLNEKIPDLNLRINEQTGALSLQREEINRLITAQKELYLVKAAEENYTTLAKERASAEIQLNELYRERERLYGGIIQKQNEYKALTSTTGGVLYSDNPKYEEAKKVRETLTSLQAGYDAAGISIKQLEDVLKQNDKQWQQNEQYIKKYTSSLDDAGASFESFAEKYKKALEAQTEAEIESLEEKLDLIGDIYDEAEEQLEDRLEAEEKAIDKSQEKRLKAVEGAQDKELSKLEKAHQKKLKLINEEYIENLKNVDEDRYNELKAVQDQIDAIDNQQEAEDRARELKQQAEKKAELQTRIENAKTVEEKLDAQKELADYEEEIARDRLKNERKLQKDILEEQKDTIKDAYDAKIKAIEDEKKKREEAAKTEYDNEKTLINEKYKLKLEGLKEEQQAEKEAFKKREEEYVKILKKQRDLASENAKKIYADDLAQYKLNQALKYDQATSSEEEMKKAIRDYANQAIMNEVDVVNAQKILGTNSLQEMLKYYNPNALLSTTSKQATSQQLTPGIITDSMTAALKNLKLVVVMDGKELGKVIDNRIEYNLR